MKNKRMKFIDRFRWKGIKNNALLLLPVMMCFLSGISFAVTFSVQDIIYKNDGTSGEATSYNSYGQAFIYRRNVANQSGTTVYNTEYLPAGSGLPATYARDTNSEWTTNPQAGDVVGGIVEIRNGLNGYSGISYVGAAFSTLTATDITNSYVQLSDIRVQAIPTPEYGSSTSTTITITWEGISTTNNSVESYVIYRSTSPNGTYTERGTRSHASGTLSYTDSATYGTTYYYKLRLRYAWASNSPAYFTTTAESQASAGIMAPAGVPTVTNINPSSAQNNATKSVTITGTNFYTVEAVWLHKTGETSITATSVVTASSTSITCDLPITGAVIGAWTVVVRSQAGTGEGTNLFTVTSEAPTVTSITPTMGANTGSVSITNLAGTNFYASPVVKLYKTGETTITATSVTRVSVNQITCSFNLSSAVIGAWSVSVTNSDGRAGTGEGIFTVTAGPPTITSITPTSGANTGSVSITNLAGTNFYASPVVKLTKTGETTITATSVTRVSANQITCSFNLTNAAMGAWNVSVTNTDGQAVTSEGLFTVTALPTVTSITPTTGANTGSVSITSLAGTRFYSGAVVKLKKTGEATITATSVTVVSTTEITCQFDLAGAVIGAWDVSVTNSNGQAGTSEGLFTVTAEAPAVTSITPNSGANSGTVNITNLAGTNFYASPVVKLTKTGETTITATSVTRVSVNQITCTFDLASAAIGAWSVSVTNTDGRAGTGEGLFTVTAGVPTVTSITPTAGANTGSVSITNLAGTNFYASPTVKLTKTGQATITATSVTRVSANQITCTFNLAGAVIGAWNVSVTNTDGGAGTGEALFTVTASAPAVSSVTPNSGVNTGTVNITSLAGTNFYSSPVVKLTKTGQTAITATSVSRVSSTEITCTFDLTGAVIGAWSVSVTNTDGRPGTGEGIFTVTAGPPTITSITPTSGANTGSVSITDLAGTNFYASPVVKLTKTGETTITATSVTRVSVNQITCTFGITGAAIGTWNVSVTNTDGQAGTNEGLFTVTAPAPTVTSITPTSAANTGPLNITSIVGTNFNTGATVKLSKTGYSDINATSVVRTNSTLMSCAVDLTGVAPGYWDLTVTNTDANSGTLSNALFVTAETPTVTAITPSTGGNDRILSITDLAGTGFYAGASAKLSKTGQGDIVATSLTVVSTSKITCSFDLRSAATGGWNVTVTNGDSRYGTLSDAFRVTTGSVETPSNCTINPLSTSSVEVTWENPDSTATSFRVEKSTDGITYTEIGYASAGGTYYRGAGTTSLTINTKYYFRVRAERDGSYSSYSTANPKYTLAATPAADAFGKVTTTAITVKWTAADNPTGTKFYCENVTTGANSGWISDISWQNTSLNAVTPYTYRIKARNDDSTETGFETIGTQTTKATSELTLIESNGVKLLTGDIIASKPKLRATMVSSVGIDKTSFRLYIDDVVITDGSSTYYDDYSERSGVATFEYTVKTALAAGTHKVKVELQDNEGTLYEAEKTDLKVMSSGGVVGVPLPYPNPYDPLKGSMKITYNLAVDSDITIYVFDTSGNFIWKQSYSSASQGGKAGYNEILWSGIDNFGRMLENDIYLIRIVNTATGALLGKTKVMVLKGVTQKDKDNDNIMASGKNGKGKGGKKGPGAVMLAFMAVSGLVFLNGMVRLYRAIGKIRKRIK